jgi:hypothetical protein
MRFQAHVTLIQASYEWRRHPPTNQISSAKGIYRLVLDASYPGRLMTEMEPIQI